jgi:hypothetical protein
MDLQELTALMQQPESLGPEQTDALKTLVNTYPYFQPARALYLKALKNTESYKYNTALKRTAAHTTDRSILFDYITSDIFNQNEISLEIKRNSEHIKSIEVKAIEDLSVNKSVAIDDLLTQQIDASKDVLDPNLFEEKKDNNFFDHDDALLNVDVAHITPETKLNIGKPLEFDNTETHSFAEWLKITSFKPINRDKTPEVSNDVSHTPLEGKLAIIDKFISENPKIKPVINTPKPKLINSYNTSEDSLMTETLARIYLEQKNYDKAIQSYRILSLKYPEKSSFFADQIKAVTELKAYNND